MPQRVPDEHPAELLTPANGVAKTVVGLHAPGVQQGAPVESVLQAEDVSFTYPDGTEALRELTLAIPRGRRVAILGANGSGKSTLFLTLNGILKPAKGRVLLGGQPVRYDRAGLNDLRRRVGLVFQDPDSQLFAASVRQDISFGPINLGLPEVEVRARVERAIQDTQIEDLADRPTHLLSYGQKKRVAIAGVLAMDPEVIVADEPTAGLDPEMTARLLDLLNQLHASGRTLVISTHDIELALAWADHVFVLRRGQLIASGRPEQVFCDRELLRSARLLPPIVLDTFARLQAQGLIPTDASPPRTAADLADLIVHCLGSDTSGAPHHEHIAQPITTS
ncbi:MAG TPA: ATP-binding cassette domain-containing protein [Chloroflexota bacterium]|nr:ATP-binding cassette domain-containing protein [Chloroflexota bacterium]